MMDIVLALGGGGVKGHAHAGVMKVLEREGFRIRAIAGTSAGGLWGVFYAAGFSPDEIVERISQMDQDRLYAREPRDGPAMMGIAGIREMLVQTLGDCEFSELHIPFAVTAVDLEHAERIVINTGRVRDAICATIAVPGIFPPFATDGRLLVDGGVLDPVPVELARELYPGLPVVAVVLSPAMGTWKGPARPRLLDSLPFLGTYLARLRIAQALNIFMRSIDVAGVMLTELRLEVDKPDVIIRPDVPHIGLLDKVDPYEVMNLGETAAIEALPQLQRLFGWRQQFHRYLNRWRKPVVRREYSNE